MTQLNWPQQSYLVMCRDDLECVLRALLSYLSICIIIVANRMHQMTFVNDIDKLHLQSAEQISHFAH